MTVDADTDAFGPEQVARTVARLGMRAEPLERTLPAAESWWERNGRRALVTLSGLALLGGFALHAAVAGGGLVALVLSHTHAQHGVDYPVVALLVLAIAAGLFHSVPKALASLRHLRPDMNALVLVSVIGAVFLEEWAEAGVLAFLYGLSGLVENWSARRARNAIGSLLRISPATAAVVHGDHEHRMPVDQVAVGARVRVRPGERIPCDGEVTDGSSHVDQALVTGESVPVWKGPGDAVFAGTVNGHGVIELRATRPASDTTLARIIRMVSESQQHRAPTERFIDRFALYYTPLMFAVAAGVAVVPPLATGAGWEHWFYQGMLILLMSCPCALVISTPVTIAAAITSAARHGALIKGGVHLEGLARLRVVALDKTGVVTRGEPDVRVIRPLGGRTESEVLARLLAVEMQSEHPLSRAVVRYARGARRRAGGGRRLPGRGGARRRGGRGRRHVLGRQRALRSREDGARPAAAGAGRHAASGRDGRRLRRGRRRLGARGNQRPGCGRRRARACRNCTPSGCGPPCSPATTARQPATSRDAWACPTSARSCCRRTR